MQQPLIKVGNDKQTIEEIGKVILEILKSGQEQKTLRAALTALQTAATVSNVTIQNCTLIGEQTLPPPKENNDASLSTD